MTATPAQAFQAWCRFLVPTEGGYSTDPNDPGNWTSGKPGVGQLRGTKFGISAAAYPTLDIATLTLTQADACRKTDYWDKVRGDELRPAVAFVLADAAYSSGPLVAIKQLQATLGVDIDGDFGQQTMDAANAQTEGMTSDAFGLDPLEEFMAAFSARRIQFEAGLGKLWSENEGGWTLRLFRGLLIARGLA